MTRISYAPSRGFERLAGDRHVLVVVHREVLAVAGTRAQRRHAQHVGDELEALAVPGEDHGAGAGEARRFLDSVRRLLTGCFGSFWIRPLGQVMRTVSTSLYRAQAERPAARPRRSSSGSSRRPSLRPRARRASFEVLDAGQADAHPVMSRERSGFRRRAGRRRRRSPPGRRGRRRRNRRRPVPTESTAAAAASCCSSLPDPWFR